MEEEGTLEEEETETTEVVHKCTKQYVMNVEKIARYHLDQQEIDQFTVATVLVIKAEEMTEDLEIEIKGDALIEIEDQEMILTGKEQITSQILSS